ncbi:MAG: hypothetical protein RLZ62_2536, partial [Bacteroidota bacterium]
MKFNTTRQSGGRAFHSPLQLGSGKNSPPERGGFRISSGISGLLAICLLLVSVHFSFARIGPEYDVFSGSFFRTALASGKALLTGHEKAITSAKEKTQISGKEIDEQSNLSALPPCNLISVSHTVSGCFLKGGVKLAIVRFEVTWDNSIQSAILNDTSDIIRITLGGQTRMINPGPFENSNQTIKSPYPVSFQVPADGSTLTAQIFTGTSFANSPCAVEISGIAIPANCVSGGGGGGGSVPTAEANCMNGQTGGIVWKDTNGDGIYQTSETSVVGGVRVEAFNKSGTPLDTAITNTAGKYVLSDVKATDYPIRIQFTQLPVGTVLGYQSDVRFVPHPSCEANFAVHEATNSSIDTTAKPFATTCFVEGDRTSTKSPSDVIVGSNTKFATPNLIASKSEAGSVWGLAYNPTKKALFSSAFLKRHVGLGSLGLGGIYVTNMTNPAAP